MLFIFLIECGHRQQNKDLLDMLMFVFVLGHIEFGAHFSTVIVNVPDLICLLCPWYMYAISSQQAGLSLGTGSVHGGL